VNAG
jgi:3-polyprenyl-4-hydroxybenzoate decarboxylase